MSMDSVKPHERHNFRTEHLFTYRITVPVDEPPLVVGELNEGISLVLKDAGNSITGPRINGAFTPGSQDFVTIGRNGVSIHRVRAVIITNDGAHIRFDYEGRGEFGPDGYQDFLRGKLPDPLRIRSAPYLQTSHPNYLWVNRLQCIDIGELYPSLGYGTFDVYALI